MLGSSRPLTQGTLTAVLARQLEEAVRQLAAAPPDQKAALQRRVNDLRQQLRYWLSSR